MAGTQCATGENPRFARHYFRAWKENSLYLTLFSWSCHINKNWVDLENFHTNLLAEAFVWMYAAMKVFWKITQNLKEDTCAKVFFLKSRRLQPPTLLKRLQGRCADVYLWILRNFLEHLFCRTSKNNCFCTERFV